MIIFKIINVIRKNAVCTIFNDLLQALSFRKEMHGSKKSKENSERLAIVFELNTVYQFQEQSLSGTGGTN